jgi:hypothetical protein
MIRHQPECHFEYFQGSEYLPYKAHWLWLRQNHKRQQEVRLLCCLDSLALARYNAIANHGMAVVTGLCLKWLVGPLYHRIGTLQKVDFLVLPMILV